ncbi:MAG: hypothetical protein IPL79_11440 [Myxococcales bacterium]|nr:hypothetical protein [Myxococcales bacterium]
MRRHQLHSSTRHALGGGMLATLLVLAAAACGPDQTATPIGGAPDGSTSGDTDGDGISDTLEGASGNVDTDGDGTPDYEDLDSDNDCRGDALEAGEPPAVDTDGDGVADFRDVDSDDDGLADAAEDANCNGVRDGAETDPRLQDSDGDGVTDLVESAAGTNPTDAADNPQANGNFVFIVPYQAPPSPSDDNLDFTTALSNVDLYVMVDRSGSMLAEITTVRDNLATVVDNLQCPPLGNGDPATCIANLWAGVGSIGYQNGDPYRHHVDMSNNPSFSSLPVAEPSNTSSINEPMTFALWSAITGSGSAASGCSVATVAARTGCPAGRFGYPCFRADALPVIMLATDEPPLTTYNCPNWSSTVRPAMQARGAKVVGILGSTTDGSVTTQLNQLATDTGAVDANNANAPLVFAGANTDSAAAIEQGLRTLALGVPLDMSARAVDVVQGGESVDAAAAFVQRLQTLQLGTALCSSGIADVDSNGDTYKDRYVNVTPGTPLCWKLVPKPNTTVPATSQPQLFKATIEVWGEDTTLLDTREVFFLVPPVGVTIS